MKFQILMSTMNLKDFSLIDECKIKSNTIIINQTDRLNYQEKIMDGKKLEIHSFPELGIGRSRNNALLKSSAEICLIADDDIEYVDDYEQMILKEFELNPKADVIVFNLDVIRATGLEKGKNKNKRLNKFTFMSHGGPQIAFKRSKILEKNIWFTLLFGGGAKYGSGEDSLFLKQAIDSGLVAYSSDKLIGTVDSRESSWFTGFNEKYLYDRGALFRTMFPKVWSLICLQFIIRHRKKFLKVKNPYKIMIQGAREYKAS